MKSKKLEEIIKMGSIGVIAVLIAIALLYREHLKQDYLEHKPEPNSIVEYIEEIKEPNLYTREVNPKKSPEFKNNFITMQYPK